MSVTTLQPPLQLSSPAAINGTNSTTDVDNFYFYQTEQITFLSILFIMIVLGNSAVLAALLLSKTRKSRMNFFIMQLAMADLLVGLISVLTDIVWRVTVEWQAGNMGCKLIRFSQATVTYSSTYVLVALSIDRYDAIKHPMNFTGSWRRARFLVIFAWVLSAVFSLPILYLYEQRVIEGSTQCWIDLPEPWHWQVYIVLVSLALLVFPAIIITLCYSIIVHTIWSKSKNLNPLPRATSMKKNKENLNSRSTCNAGKEDYGSRRASSRGIIPKAKIKTIKMTFVIVFVFVICWSPYIIFDLLQVYGYIPRTQSNIAMATFIQSLAPLNSAANPIIYCVFSSHTCRNLRRIPLINWCAENIFCCCPSVTSTAEESSTFGHKTTYVTSMNSTVAQSRVMANETRYHNGTAIPMRSFRRSSIDNGRNRLSYSESIVRERLLKEESSFIANVLRSK